MNFNAGVLYKNPKNARIALIERVKFIYFLNNLEKFMLKF